MSHSFRQQSREGVLTLSFTDAQILDAAVIEQMHRDLMQVLGQSDDANLLLDFRLVQFMSSAALGMLIRVHKKCRELKKVLKLSSIAPDILKVFRVTNLDRIFDIYANPEAALAAFAA